MEDVKYYSFKEYFDGVIKAIKINLKTSFYVLLSFVVLEYFVLFFYFNYDFIRYNGSFTKYILFGAPIAILGLISIMDYLFTLGERDSKYVKLIDVINFEGACFFFLATAINCLIELNYLVVVHSCIMLIFTIFSALSYRYLKEYNASAEPFTNSEKENFEPLTDLDEWANKYIEEINKYVSKAEYGFSSIGVRGNWGSGKTSIIYTTIIRNLESDDQNKRNIYWINDFNSLLYQDDESLIEGIASKIYDSVYRDKLIRFTGNKIHRLVDSISVKFINIVPRFRNNDYYIKKMINEIKKEVSNKDTTYAFIIDDLERLDFKSIIFIMSVFEELFQFKNISVIYLMNYSELVRRAHIENVNINIIDKFINHYIDIPDAKTVVDTILYEEYFRNRLDKFDNTRLDEITYFIKTPRDAKKFLQCMIKDEIIDEANLDYNDVVYLSSFKLCYSKEYSYLIDNYASLIEKYIIPDDADLNVLKEEVNVADDVTLDEAAIVEFVKMASKVYHQRQNNYYAKVRKEYYKASIYEEPKEIKTKYGLENLILIKSIFNDNIVKNINRFKGNIDTQIDVYLTTSDLKDIYKLLENIRANQTITLREIQDYVMNTRDKLIADIYYASITSTVENKSTDNLIYFRYLYLLKKLSKGEYSFDKKIFNKVDSLEEVNLIFDCLYDIIGFKDSTGEKLLKYNLEKLIEFLKDKFERVDFYKAVKHCLMIYYVKQAYCEKRNEGDYTFKHYFKKLKNESISTQYNVLKNLLTTNDDYYEIRFPNIKLSTINIFECLYYFDSQDRVIEIFNIVEKGYKDGFLEGVNQDEWSRLDKVIPALREYQYRGPRYY